MKASYVSSSGPDRINPIPVCAALLVILFVLLPFVLARVALGAPMRSSDPSLLEGPPPGPCAGAAAYPDYIGGTDVNGYPVAPADLPGPVSVTLPSDRVFADVPTGRHSDAQMAVDVHGLRDLMNAPDGCAVHMRHHRH